MTLLFLQCSYFRFFALLDDWALKCVDQNAGCYLEDKFKSCFPDRLVVGDADNHAITFTSSNAVMTFLPQQSAVSSLSMNYTDPKQTPQLGRLAGEMTALSLNVVFDDCDRDFADPVESLGEQVYCSTGPCSGMTIDEILTIGNQALGATISMPYTFEKTGETFSSLSSLNECIEKINENYPNGNKDEGYICPPGCKSPTTGPKSSPSNQPSLSHFPSSNPSLSIAPSSCGFGSFLTQTHCKFFDTQSLLGYLRLLIQCVFFFNIRLSRRWLGRSMQR